MGDKTHRPARTDPSPQPTAGRAPPVRQPRGNAAAQEALRSRNGTDIPAHHPMLERMAHDLAYRDAAGLQEPEVRAFLAEHCYGEATLIEGEGGYEAVSIMPDLLRPECAGTPPVLAHRGTEDVEDVYTDFDRDGPGAGQYRDNAPLISRNVEAMASASGSCVIQTGHSLGGANAQRAAAAQPGQTCEVVTSQSPGVNLGVADRFDALHGRGGMSGREIPVTHYIAAGDLVSATGERHLSGRNVLVNKPVADPIEAHKAHLLNDVENTHAEAVPTHPALYDPEIEDLRRAAGGLREGVASRISPSRLLDIPSDPAVFRKEGHDATIKRADALEQEVADEQISGARSAADINLGMEVLKAHRGRGSVEILHE